MESMILSIGFVAGFLITLISVLICIAGIPKISFLLIGISTLVLGAIQIFISNSGFETASAIFLIIEIIVIIALTIYAYALKKN